MAYGEPDATPDEHGDAMPQIEWWTLDLIKRRLGGNQHRRRLLDGLLKACVELRRHGCGAIYLGGSFVDEEIEYPGDYDACFDTVGLASTVDEVLYLPDKDVERREFYRGDWMPARLDPGPSGRWLRFFGTDRNGNRRTLIGLKLRLNELIADD